MIGSTGLGIADTVDGSLDERSVVGDLSYLDFLPASGRIPEAELNFDLSRIRGKTTFKAGPRVTSGPNANSLPSGRPTSNATVPIEKPQASRSNTKLKVTGPARNDRVSHSRRGLGPGSSAGVDKAGNGSTEDISRLLKKLVRHDWSNRVRASSKNGSQHRRQHRSSHCRRFGSEGSPLGTSGCDKMSDSDTSSSSLAQDRFPKNKRAINCTEREGCRKPFCKSCSVGRKDCHDCGTRQPSELDSTALLQVNRELVELAEFLKKRQVHLTAWERALRERESYIADAEQFYEDWNYNVKRAAKESTVGANGHGVLKEPSVNHTDDLLPAKISPAAHLIKKETRTYADEVADLNVQLARVRQDMANAQKRAKGLCESNRSLREAVNNLQSEIALKDGKIGELTRQLKSLQKLRKTVSGSTSSLTAQMLPTVNSKQDGVGLAEGTSAAHVTLEFMRQEKTKAVNCQRTSFSAPEVRPDMSSYRIFSEKDELVNSLAALLEYALGSTRNVLRILMLSAIDNDDKRAGEASLDAIRPSLMKHQVHNASRVYDAAIRMLPLMMCRSENSLELRLPKAERPMLFTLPEWMSANLQELYFEAVLRLVSLPSDKPVFEVFQRRYLAEQLYTQYLDFVDRRCPTAVLQHPNTRLRVAVVLTIITGIAQADVVKAMMGHLLSELVETEARRSFVEFSGIEVIHPFLRLERHMAIVSHASAVVLNMCSEGVFRTAFLRQCTTTDCIESCRRALEAGLLNDQIAISENVGILLQKLSSVRTGLCALSANERLVNVLRAISVGDNICFELARPCSPPVVSEFLLLNVQLTVKALDTPV